jgi:hypothetical protein
MYAPVDHAYSNCPLATQINICFQMLRFFDFISITYKFFEIVNAAYTDTRKPKGVPNGHPFAGQAIFSKRD